MLFIFCVGVKLKSSLSWKSVKVLCVLLQVVSSAAPTEHPASSAPCSISVSGSASGPNSISLTLTTAGLNCSFSVASPDVGTDASECRRVTERELQGNETERPRSAGGGVFTCALDHLEPGAAYLLQVQSQTDDESANVTLHTSELQKLKLRFD